MPVAVMHTDDTATAKAQSTRGAKTDPACDATLRTTKFQCAGIPISNCARDASPFAASEK